jgi:hypothetical protein
MLLTNFLGKKHINFEVKVVNNLAKLVPEDFYEFIHQFFIILLQFCIIINITQLKSILIPINEFLREVKKV